MDGVEPEEWAKIHESEQEVAQVLSALKAGHIPSHPETTLPSLNSAMQFPTPPISQSPSVESLVQSDMESMETSPRSFMARVADLPMVNSTIKTIGSVYEGSKNRNAFVKYSAETVESSVRTIYDNITMPVLNRVNSALQLDQFACRQLDKLERNYPIIKETPTNVYDTAVSHYLGSDNDTLKTLRFCLEWLQYATQHIDQQISVLKSALRQPETFHSLHSLRDLADHAKREVVHTLRHVVDVISKSAGRVLPQESRLLVRGFILSLPNRWASINQALATPMPNQVSPDGSCVDPQQEAQRVLTLAEESNSMLKNTLNVFHQTTTAAEYWLGRQEAGEMGAVQMTHPASHTNESMEH